METDASECQLGVQLLQEQPDKSFRPLGFWSRQSNSAERNYSPTEREALAIVWAVKICRPHVERTSFLVRTDHQALRWLFSTSSTDGNPRIVRWKLALAGFEFTVEYTPGSKNKVPDELSRMETTGLSPAPEDDAEIESIPCLLIPGNLQTDPDTPVFPRAGPLVQVPEPIAAILEDELSDAQSRDPWCQSLYVQLGSGVEAPTPPGLGLTEGGLLYCGSVVNQSLPNRWIVPASLRQRVCMLHHFARLSRHPGITRMTQTVSRSWY